MDSYRFLSKIGEGTFAEVFKVKHRETGKVYALKRFKKQYTKQESAENMREVQALKRLQGNENVVQMEEALYDLKTNTFCILFELLENNLYTILSSKASRINEEQAKSIIYQALKGLDFMHSKGIFHRDVKPENILINGDVVKLADFGSCSGSNSRLPLTGYIATRWYRPPECLLSSGFYGAKIDIWGMGCVLYELITKVPLFPGKDPIDQIHRIHSVLGTPSKIVIEKLIHGNEKLQGMSFPVTTAKDLMAFMPGISSNCVDLIKRMLAYDPENRITAKEALQHPFFKQVDKNLNSKSISSVQRLTKHASEVALKLLDVNVKKERIIIQEKQELASLTRKSKVPRKNSFKQEEWEQAAVFKNLLSKPLESQPNGTLMYSRRKPKEAAVDKDKLPAIHASYLKQNFNANSKHSRWAKEKGKLVKGKSDIWLPSLDTKR